MRVNIGSLMSVLASLVEGQDSARSMSHYRDQLQRFLELVRQRDPAFQLRFSRDLKRVLLYVLNNRQLDYETIFVDASDFSLGGQEHVRRLLEMIWKAFFPEDEWLDPDHVDPSIVLVEDPYEI